MTASPQTRNYLYGKGELFFRAVGSEGYDHLGNAPAFTISLTEEKLEHFSSMSGTKTKDLQLVTQKGATVAFTLEEFTTGNILRAFKARRWRSRCRPPRRCPASPSAPTRACIRSSARRSSASRVWSTARWPGGRSRPVPPWWARRPAPRRPSLCDGRGFGVRKRAGDFCARRGDRRLCNQSHVAGIAASPMWCSRTSQRADRPLPPGVDYDLNARTGLLRVRESCSADTVFLTADCESSDEQLVDALTASDVTGELLFVGQPDQGRGLSCNAGR